MGLPGSLSIHACAPLFAPWFESPRNAIDDSRFREPEGVRGLPLRC
jgi:hypothetical protein